MVKNPQKGHVRKILVQSASHRPVRKIVTAQLNITKNEIMRKIDVILINIHNLWKRNVYKTYFLP